MTVSSTTARRGATTLFRAVCTPVLTLPPPSPSYYWLCAAVPHRSCLAPRERLWPCLAGGGPRARLTQKHAVCALLRCEQIPTSRESTTMSASTNRPRRPRRRCRHRCRPRLRHRARHRPHHRHPRHRRPRRAPSTLPTTTRATAAVAATPAGHPPPAHGRAAPTSSPHP